jgi:hypothetical protein
MYNLRARTVTGLATQLDRAPDEVPARSDNTDAPSSIDAPSVTGLDPVLEAPVAVRMYSQVVASSPPSPAMERYLQPSDEPTAVQEGTGTLTRSEEERRPVSSNNNAVNIGGYTYSETSEHPEWEDNSPWTTVRRRKARSQELPMRGKPLTSEQVQVVNIAAGSLTDEQRKNFQRRQEKIPPQRDDSVSSRGEGFSMARRQGKTIDPREWGNVNLSRESLDIEAQAAAFASFKTPVKPTDYPGEDTPGYQEVSQWADSLMAQASSRPPSEKTDRKRRHSQRATRPRESQPAAQIAPRSYLGTALKHIERASGSRHVPRMPSSDPSSSPDSSSSSSGEEDRSVSSNDDSVESEPEPRRRKRRRDNKHGRNRRRPRPSSESSSDHGQTTIKPIPPREYDGAADVRAYHRFVRESDAYLRDGKVKGRRKVFLLSYYLAGKAYDFYTQKVAIDEERWTVPQFYRELFNYCFPVDYRMQLRRTLARCHQNDRSIAEYTHELQELFNMIGDIPAQDQVIKFWNGAKPMIQKELWKNNLNPEVSSWRKVVSRAEIIEIAEGVAERRDRKQGPSSQPLWAPSGSNGGNARSKHPPTDGSVRAVTFETSKRSHDRRHGKSHSRTPHQQPARPPRAGPSSYQPGMAGNQGRAASRSYNPAGQTHHRSHNHRAAPRLSDKEKEEYRAAGKCFVCGGVGHISRNCPDNTVVRSRGQGPPGASTFNLEPVLPEEDDSAGHVEVLDSLPLGAIFAGDNDWDIDEYPGPGVDWRDHYPYWCRPGIHPRKEIGDCYCMVASASLTTAQPYPGDVIYEPTTVRPDFRFEVKRQPGSSEYIIIDRLAEVRTFVEGSLLENRKFDVARWYAKRRSDRFRMEFNFDHHSEMGYAVNTVASKLLVDGISSEYPCTNPRLNPEDRFTIYPRQPNDDNYRIHDRDLEMTLPIPRTLLEDPSFDLVGWYRQRLEGSEMNSIFRCRYKERHTREYVDELDIVRELEQMDIGDGNSADEGSASNDSEAIEPSDPFDICDLESEDEWEPLSRPSVSESSGFSDIDMDTLPDELETDPDEADESTLLLIGDSLAGRIMDVLTRCQPFPGDGTPADPCYRANEHRFLIEARDDDVLEVYDRVQGFESRIRKSLAQWEGFSIGKWYAERCAYNTELEQPWKKAHEWMTARRWEDTAIGQVIDIVTPVHEALSASTTVAEDDLELAGVQVDRHKYPALQRNASQVKGRHRILPKPVVVSVIVNDHPARALLDSGSLGDFISSTLTDQLHVQKKTLDVPLSLQLAVQGSRSKVNYAASVRLRYQGIDEERTLDVININSYDLILGTPWLYQHKVCLGFNPARVIIGNDESMPLKVSPDTKLLIHSLSMEDRRLEEAREELRRYADPLCKEVHETDLPPFRAINHTIPLIDEQKTYPWRPSKCPEVFRAQWAEKRDAYIRSGRWKITAAGNTVPMLLITKPGTNPPELRTVVDLRERNKNTQRQTSPLPDMEGMLRRTASKPFRTALDLKSAYEQIRIVPEHVGRSTVTTPDGNMVSQVIQIGDCNAPATYQALMNFLFSSYIGRFMDIYLDDIVIYSDTLAEHVRHVKLVLDILLREKLYLSRSKLRFIASELKILGRLIDNEGIRMDTAKVDSVLNWKVPTNRDLLRGFIGSVGYLADDIPNVRIPMGVLSAITGDTVPFRWGFTEQRAFSEVKALVHDAREHRRVPLNYTEGALPIWMITDGCATGISGVVSQGSDWKTAKVAAFYSAKLNPAQQNYPVHEIEMLAGIETMLRHADILQGTKFKWLTDHKGLTYLLNQKNLSGRQARWLEKISNFTFEVVYITGCENVIADALSRMYSNDSKGTERARSEYTYHDIVDEDTLFLGLVTEELPVLAGIEARLVSRRGTRVRRPTEKAAVMLEEANSGAETSKDFAARMKSSFVLRGPRTPAEQKEGGSTVDNRTSDTAGPLEGTRTSNPVPVEDVASQSNTTLLDIVSQSLQGIDLVAEIRGKYDKDPTFQPILERPSDFRNFVVRDRLVYLLKDPEREVLCVPKVLIQGRSARERVISEAHSMLAHLGANKTLDYLRDHVWWKDMVSDVKAFCETCHTCKISKPSNQKPYGLLNPLSVPGYPWESIGMDFVGPLPESGNRDGQFDSITVVICLLTSMVHLVPSRTNYNASQLAELMFEHVYKLHGLPQNIISDRDVLFTSTFWSRLHRLIGTKLRMSSAYHPQSDGSTERANRTITQMLRQCIQPDQKDWVSKLPAIEFAINSARSESTGYAPFFLNSGRMPRAMLWNSASTSEYPSVRDFALQKKLAIISAHDSILAARIKQTRDANRKRQAVPFNVGDLVYLSAKNISFPKGLARKLLPKFLGPYKILQDFGNASFQLELPAHLKRRGVHDVFHSSLLRIHVPNDDRLFPGRMDTQLDGTDMDDEWAVDRILSHTGARKEAVFEIKWKSGDVTWLPHYQITHLNALTEYLDLLGCNQIEKLPNGAGQPPQGDPQLFLGAVSLISQSNFISTFPHSHFLKSHPEYYHYDTSAVHSVSNPPYPDHPESAMPFLSGINHPRFTRISPTTYLMRDPNHSAPLTIHTGQIADYIRFDDRLRVQNRFTASTQVPIGFTQFSSTWNEGAAPTDLRRVSTLYYSDQPASYSADISHVPVRLTDFHITPIQAGILPASYQPTSSLQSDVQQEFTALMVEKQKRIRFYQEEREAKRMRVFNPDADHLGSTISHSHHPVKPRRQRKRRHQTTSATDTGSSSQSPIDFHATTEPEIPLVPGDHHITDDSAFGDDFIRLADLNLPLPDELEVDPALVPMDFAGNN